MADAKKVKIGGVWYYVKDETARNGLTQKVSKSGDTMTGNLTTTGSSYIIRRDGDKLLRFHDASDNEQGAFYLSNSNHRMAFRMYDDDYSNTEVYNLPAPDSLTANKSYNILTSKNIDTTPTASSTNPVTSGGVKTALDGKVNKSGDTMTGNLTMERSTDPSIYFKQSDTSRSAIFLRDNQFYFNEYPADQQSYREVYSLPKPDSGLTAAKWYSILTSKTPVTVAQGGTGKTNATDARHALGVRAVQQIQASTDKAYKLTGDGVNGFTFTLKRSYDTACICFVDYWDDVRYIGTIPSWLTVVKNTGENSVIIQQTSGTVAAFIITAIGATIEEVARDESRTNTNFNNGYITTDQITGTLPIANGGTGGTDAGYQALTAGSGVNSGTIKYRKIGSWVEIRGKDVKLKSALTASYLTLLNVPSAIRPNEKVVLSSGFKVASSGVLEPAYCELTTSGNIDLCRPSVVSSITTNDLINFSAMYFV